MSTLQVSPSRKDSVGAKVLSLLGRRADLPFAETGNLLKGLHRSESAAALIGRKGKVRVHLIGGEDADLAQRLKGTRAWSAADGELGFYISFS